MLRALRSVAEELFFKGEAQIFFTLQNMSMWCAALFGFQFMTTLSWPPATDFDWREPFLLVLVALL